MERYSMKHIINFIDCGAHKGQSIILARQKFSSICDELRIYSFEAIPYLAYKLQEFYKNDPLVKIYNNAIWTENCKKSFFASKTKASWGSSLYNRFEQDDTVHTNVDCIDFSQWIKDNLDESHTNILKLDIEGAEYAVLTKLMDDSTLDYFNLLLGEWHHDKIKTGIDPYSIVDRLQKEYNTELISWEAPWYNVDTTPGMIKFTEDYSTTEQWLNYKNK